MERLQRYQTLLKQHNTKAPVKVIKKMAVKPKVVNPEKEALRKEQIMKAAQKRVATTGSLTAKRKV